MPSAEGGIAAQADYNKLLILGGANTNSYTLGATDPTWQASITPAASPMPYAASSPGVGALPGGQYFIVFGGSQGGVATAAAFQYDANNGGDNNNNQDLNPMNTARASFGYATDSSGLNYAIGGVDGSGHPLASMEVYNASTGNWTYRAPLPQTLYGESALSDGAGHIYTFGGVGANGAITTNVYRYTISTNTWDQVASLQVGVRNSAAVLGSNGLIYVLGGITSTATTTTVESYNIGANAWDIETSLPAPLSSLAVATDSLGRIEVVGGFDGNNNPTASVYVSQELNQPDAAPTFTTTASKAVLVNTPYSYQVFTTANPQATYTLTAAPAGMTIDPTTGLVSWSPDYSGEGIQTVTIQASNYAGQTMQTYLLDVTPPAPTGLTGAGVSTSSVTLSWTASSDPNVTSYDVYQRTFIHDPKGSGGTYVYSLLASGVTGTSATVGGLRESGPGGGWYTFLVKAVDSAGLQSAYSAPVTAQTLYPADLWGFMTTGGAVISSLNVTQGQTAQIYLLSYGNEAPTYSIVSGPPTVSVDATTGLVTYTPGPTELGNVIVTFQATNSTGSSQDSFTFVVQDLPTVVINAGPFTYDGTAHLATAVAYGTDGKTPVNGTFTFTYNGSSTAPTAAGTYTVVATFTSSDPNYADATGTASEVINQATPTFSNLSSPVIKKGTTSTTFSGNLAAGSLFPTGDSVSVTVHGITQTALVDSSGNFSVSFATGTWAAGSDSITYAFAGDGANFGAASNGTGTLTVAMLKVTVQPKSQTILAGNTVTFTAAASSYPAATVQWQVSTDGGKTYSTIAGATNTTLSFTTATSENHYKYRAVFTNILGSVNSSAATLTVDSAPTVTLNPTNKTVSAGQTVTFKASASGYPKPTVQWQISTDGGQTWTDITGATSTTLSFIASASDNGDLFQAVFTNIIGSATTTAALLTVL